MAELNYGGATANWLKKNMPIQSQAKYVEYGFGQVEPNHLSAQRTAQVYAQLPANKDIELLDSPGILWPKIENQTHAYNLASLSSIKEEILDPYELSTHILKTMYKLYPENLKNRYGIENIDFDDIVPTLDLIAVKRGALLKGGEKDYDKVYSIIIRDLKENLLGNVTFDRIEEIQK